MFGSQWEDNQLVANQNDRFSGMQVTRWWVGNRQVAVLVEPVAFFTPEDARIHRA